MKNLEENLLKHLLEPGQSVYLQNNDWRSGRNRKLTLVSYTDEKVIDFFSNCHGKLITFDDLEVFKSDQGKLGKQVEVTNGTTAIVLSCFHWGFTENELNDLIENKKIESPEEAVPTLYCFLLLDETLALAQMSFCRPTNP